MSKSVNFYIIAKDLFNANNKFKDDVHNFYKVVDGDHIDLYFAGKPLPNNEEENGGIVLEENKDILKLVITENDNEYKFYDLSKAILRIDEVSKNDFNLTPLKVFLLDILFELKDGHYILNYKPDNKPLKNLKFKTTLILRREKITILLNKPPEYAIGNINMILMMLSQNNNVTINGKPLNEVFKVIETINNGTLVEFDLSNETQLILNYKNSGGDWDFG